MIEKYGVLEQWDTLIGTMRNYIPHETIRIIKAVTYKLCANILDQKPELGGAIVRVSRANR